MRRLCSKNNSPVAVARYLTRGRISGPPKLEIRNPKFGFRISEEVRGGQMCPEQGALLVEGCKLSLKYQREYLNFCGDPVKPSDFSRPFGGCYEMSWKFLGIRGLHR